MYPAMLQLEGRRATVIGGGTVAYRKAKTLVACGAKVHIFAPSFDEGWGEIGRASCGERVYVMGCRVGGAL